MSAGIAGWKGRRKDEARCLAEDLRVFSPMIGVVLCALASASFIFAAERIDPDRFEVLARIVRLNPAEMQAMSRTEGAGTPHVSQAPPASETTVPGETRHASGAPRGSLAD